MLVSNERAAPIPGCALLIPEHPNLETSHKPQAAKLLDPKDRATSDKLQAASRRRLFTNFGSGYKYPLAPSGKPQASSRKPQAASSWNLHKVLEASV